MSTHGRPSSVLRFIPRFRISTLMLIFTVLAIALAWHVDRRQLIERIEQHNPPISRFGEKYELWSPANYLDRDRTNLSLEAVLAGRVGQFEGKLVTSSQGLGDDQLRQPTDATLDAVIALFDDGDPAVRTAAAQLVSLYLQAVCGSRELNTASLATRVYFQAHGLKQVYKLLNDRDRDVRAAAALVLGNTLYDRYTMQLMTEAFDRETNGSVKLRLSWAYWKIGNNYDLVRY